MRNDGKRKKPDLAIYVNGRLVRSKINSENDIWIKIDDGKWHHIVKTRKNAPR